MTTALAPNPIDTNAHIPDKAPEAYTPAATAPTDIVKAIPKTLKSEWIKASTVRSNMIIVGLAITVSGFVSWAVANFVTDEVLTTAEVFTFATVFTAVFAAIAGILLYSSEAQHGTLAPSLTAQPSRSVIAVSKTVLAAGFGAFVGLSGLLAGAAGSMLAGIEMGDTSGMVADGGRAILFTALAAVLGLGIGMIARHSTAAISGLLVWWLVVENLLTVFVAERFARFLPFVSGNGLIGATTGPETGGESLTLSLTENGLIFGAYALAALVVGTIIFRRRDNN